MPLIFDYLDYPGYLTAFLAEKKAEGSRISLRSVAKSLGCDASFLAKVLHNKKSLPANLKGGLFELLGLSKKEREYFEHLILLRKAKLHSEKNRLLQSLNRMRKDRFPSLAPDQFVFYEKWYYTVVLQLLDFMDFKDDYAALGKALDPPISPAQAKKSIALLSKLSLIVRDKDGYFRKTSAALTTGEGWQSVAIANYQMENLDLARKAFEKHSLKARRFSTLTLSLSEAAAGDLMEQLQAFEKKCLTRAVEDTAPSRVYQFNFQAFPVSRLDLTEED